LQHNDQRYTFDDLCLRSVPSNPVCDSLALNFFTLYFGGNQDLWANSSTIEYLINEDPVRKRPALFLGGLQYEAEEVVGAQTLRLRYELEGSTDEEVRDTVYEYMGEWQTFWSERSVEYNEEDGLAVNYYSDRSFDDEISRILSDDIPIFVLALTLMLLYLMCTLGKVSCVGARPWLACSAILVMLCALAIGFSASLASGATFNTIVMLVPFILLGVGVDDMIILVDTYDRTPMPDDDVLNAHVRLGHALSSSGLSITLTSLSSAMAFFIGSIVDIPGISSFCIYAAFCFLSNYVLQFVIFVPLMVIDDQRIRNKKNFCCPLCVSHDKKRSHQTQIKFFDPEKVVKNNGAQSSTKYRSDSVQLQLSPHMITSNSTQLNNGNETAPITGCSHRCNACNADCVLTTLLLPLFKHRVVRWLIMLCFCATLIASVLLIGELSTDDDPRRLVPDDSYVLEFINRLDAGFDGESIDTLQIVVLNVDFANATQRAQVAAMLNALESAEHAVSLVDDWIREYREWLWQQHLLDLDALPSSEFYAWLQVFTNASRWQSEIVFDSVLEPQFVKHTRFELSVQQDAVMSREYLRYLAWNEIVREYLPDDQVFAMFPEHCFAYLSSHILQLTVNNMVFAGAGVFGVLCLFLDVRVCVFIACVVAMIDAHLFGWMWLCGIALDTLSYSQCVMAVGLTVDYVIHISHAMVDVDVAGAGDGDPKLQRIALAISHMGTSVAKGAWTTLLGALALAFSQSQAFRTFLYMFVGIISIAVAHGMILTPAVLTEFSFIFSGVHANEREQQHGRNESEVDTADGQHTQTAEMVMSDSDMKQIEQRQHQQRNSGAVDTAFKPAVQLISVPKAGTSKKTNEATLQLGNRNKNELNMVDYKSEQRRSESFKD